MTPQQQTTLAFIRDFSREFGHAPTLEEIGAALGIRSKGAVHRLVQTLVAKGHLAREPG